MVALTGSSGKTSTKDLIAQLARALGPDGARRPGSFNNEIGLPLTVLSAGEDTRYLVLEMGARGIGHIALPGRPWPRRDIGVVLNVGSAHIGEFGSRRAIAQAKGELVEALPLAAARTSRAAGGVAVLNADDPLVARDGRADAGRASCCSAGQPEGRRPRRRRCPARRPGRAGFTLATPRPGAPTWTLRLHGEHQVSNALAAAAVACGLGMPVERSPACCPRPVRSAAGGWRSPSAPDGVTVVNDAYNANPESMRAAPAALRRDGRARASGRTWAVLGEMRELGAASRRRARRGRAAGRARLGCRPARRRR